MFESALLLGRIRGIRIQVHYTWLVIFALLSLSLGVNFREAYPAWGEWVAYGAALAGVLLFFTSIVLHELGHSLVALARGIPVRSITLFIFGGVAELERESETARDEFMIAAAGPLVSFALAALFLVIAPLLAPFSEPASVTAGWLGFINAAVAIFNLVPGFPLDGGRIFRAIIWGVTGDARKGMQVAVAGGRLTAWALFALGIWMALGAGNLIGGIWFVAVGWFLLNAAEASGRSFQVRAALGDVSVGELVRSRPPEVPADQSLEHWVREQVLGEGRRSALVVEDGVTVGLVSLSDARRVPRDAWSTTPVRQVMTARESLHTVAPEAGLVEVLELLGRHRLNQIPVGRDNELTGWLDRDEVLQALRIRLELEGGGP